MTLVFLPYFGSGQTINLKNRVEFKGDTLIFLDGNYNVLPLDSMGYGLLTSDTFTFSEIKPERRNKIHSTIKLYNDGAKIDTAFARNDLERDRAKDSQIFLDGLIIDSYQQELAEKDTIISEQNKQISDLQQRYLDMSNSVVICEKTLKSYKRSSKIYRWCFIAMMGIAFGLGVK